MKAILRYLFLAICLSSYGFFVFSASYISPSNIDSSNAHHSENMQLSELSKIVFPQSINTEVNNFISVQVESEGKQSLIKAFITIQYLSKLTHQFDVNYFKESKYIGQQFPISDIIYPFHDFW